MEFIAEVTRLRRFCFNIVNTKMENIKTFLTGATGLGGSIAVTTFPTPDSISEIAGVLVQIVIGIVTLISLLKKNKEKK